MWKKELIGQNMNLYRIITQPDQIEWGFETKDGKQLFFPTMLKKN